MHSEAKALECWIHYVDNVSIALFDKACLLFPELHKSHVIINYSRTQLTQTSKGNGKWCKLIKLELQLSVTDSKGLEEWVKSEGTWILSVLAGV